MFWTLSGTEIYDAISWDRLHSYHLGLFGDHLLAHLRDLVKSSRESVVMIDSQYAVILNFESFSLCELTAYNVSFSVQTRCCASLARTDTLHGI